MHLAIVVVVVVIVVVVVVVVVIRITCKSTTSLGGAIFVISDTNQ
jgi:hypothetical protein